MFRFIPLLVTVVWVTPLGLPAQGAEPTTLRDMIDATVEKVQVFASGADSPAKPLVAIRWANNQRGSEDGMTVLYIHEGRPVAAACLYPWAGNLVHDFELLDRGSVVARRDGQMLNAWIPSKTSVVRQDIPDAPPPAETAARRLRQIKSLAERFESTMLGWKRDDTDRETLRMLPRPLYRYQPHSGNILDGAVFGFVMGTDPETLLLIEAIEEEGKARWQYGFARRTSGELEGRLDGKVVWKATRYPETKDPKLPHFSLGTPIPPAIAETLKASGQ